MCPRSWGWCSWPQGRAWRDSILHECEVAVGAPFIREPGTGRSEAPGNEDPCFGEQVGGRGGATLPERQHLDVHFQGQHKVSMSLELATGLSAHPQLCPLPAV